MVFKAGYSVQAESSWGLDCRQKELIMELQTLQEALKVEIQIHQKLVAQMKQDPQNVDLKTQLHELQAKITALSERQKKVVEQLRKDLLVKQEQLDVQADGKAPTPPTGQAVLSLPAHSPGGQQKAVPISPVISSKTLPLVLKATTPTMPASAVTQRPTVAMVTAISNMPKTGAVSPDSQSAPMDLQTTGKLTNQGVDPVRIVPKNAVVVQATSTAQPIKVPQFIPPPRLTPRPSFLPQVRPKPATPNNVPIAPAPPPPMMAAPQLLQRPVMLTTKLASAPVGPSAGPVHQVHIVNGQPCPTIAKSLTGIVITTPNTHLASSQTLQISSVSGDAKTVKAQGTTEQTAPPSGPSRTPTPPPPPKPKREENPQKLAFMVALGLVTHDHLEEIQSRRQERKRRTTANPVYSGAVFEPERKKSTVTYLNTPLHQGTRKRANEESLSKVLKKEEAIPWPGTLAIVHSYIAYKAAKEEEKQKLVKWSTDLKQEREQLEQRVKLLSSSITKCMETKNSILAQQKEMQASLEKVKGLVRLIQSTDVGQSLETDGVNDHVTDCRGGRASDSNDAQSDTHRDEDSNGKTSEPSQNPVQHLLENSESAN